MSDYLILQFIVLAGIFASTSGNTDLIYAISPTINDACLPERCLTLSQFAANSTFIGLNTTLIFLDGEHFLKSDLIVTSATNFFIASSDNLVSVICEPSTELSFTSTACVRIKHIRFLNCTIKAFHINQLTIEDCSFELNTGKLLQLVRTSALIQRSSLANVNSRNETIVTVSHGNIAFKECHFKDMIATVGLYAHNSNTNITDSKVKNLAGIFLLLESDYFCQTCTVIINCTFLMNERIIRSIGSFESNNVSHIDDSLLWIDECHFISNTGQVVACSRGNIIISKTKFVNNSANESSLMYMSPHFGNIWIEKSEFRGTIASRGGAISLNGDSFIKECTFDKNYAIRGGALSFKGKIVEVVDCLFIKNEAVQNGGAIQVTYSNLNSSFILSNTSFINNRAGLSGGALHVEGLQLTSFNNLMFIDSAVTVANNTAQKGGGIYLHHSEILCRGNCSLMLLGNIASFGGGMYAEFSYVKVQLSITNHDGTGGLLLFNNTAKEGGGIYINSTVIYNINVRLCVNNESSSSDVITVNFIHNSADKGGAVYFSGERPNVKCYFQNECYSTFDTEYYKVFVSFSNNSAEKFGASVFSVGIELCKLGEDKISISELGSLQIVSNIHSSDFQFHFIQICFCINNYPVCGITSSSITATYEGLVSIKVAVLDEENNAVNGSILAIAADKAMQLQNNQLVQEVYGCTLLQYNTISTRTNQIIHFKLKLGFSLLNVVQIIVTFPSCISCPIGFKKAISQLSGCNCKCNPKLIKLGIITGCNSSTGIIVRDHTTAWISYVNNSEDSASGYFIYPFCPQGYCYPPDTPVNINLNVPNGEDAQCAFNHSGILCGACKNDLSLSLGSIYCIQCSTHWQAVMVAILLGGIFGGMVFVSFLLVLNLTIAVGTLNGLIFYANIVYIINGNLQSSGFLGTFIALFNLDLGIDTCFYKGMDAYGKVWIGMMFPAYLILISIIIILFSEKSLRFAKLIGQKNPVATLGTLILLSYIRFLRSIISSYSFAILQYPDNSSQVVWLPDANVLFFSGKHIALFAVATVILVIGIAYTAILFLWQWLLQCQGRRWLRNQKLLFFIEPYHAPYSFKHRYWTGLLLILRIAIYIASAANVSGNRLTILLIIGVVISCLVIFKSLINTKVYRKKIIDVLEMINYANLLWLCLAHMFELNQDETTVNTISMSIAFILFCIVILYHVYTELHIATKLVNCVRKLKRSRNSYHIFPSSSPRIKRSHFPLINKDEVNTT